MYSKIPNIHKLYNLQIYKLHWVNITFTKKIHMLWKIHGLNHKIKYI